MELAPLVLLCFSRKFYQEYGHVKEYIRKLFCNKAPGYKIGPFEEALLSRLLYKGNWQPST